MKKIGIFFGSTTGTTESVANMIAEKLHVSSSDVYSVSDLSPEQAQIYDILIMGTSTWGCGELQDDWYDGIRILQNIKLDGKTVCLFGCGDSESYSDTFCDAMGILYQELANSGCQFIGYTDIQDYTFTSSIAVIDGHFVGLAIDDVNESNKTAERIARWSEQIKSYLD